MKTILSASLKSLLSLSLFLILYTDDASAQEPKIRTTAHIKPEQALGKKRNSTNYLEGNKDEVLVSDRTKRGLIITSYSKEGLTVINRFLADDPKVGNKDPDWLRRVFKGDNVVNLYAYYDKKTDQNTVYGKITDRDNNEVKEPIILMQTESRKKKFIGGFSTRISKDQSKVLIFHQPNSSDPETRTVHIALYDFNLKKISDKEYTFPTEKSKVSIYDVFLTDDGDVMVVGKFTPTKEEVKANPDLKGKTAYKVFCVTDGEMLDEIKIDSEDHTFSSCYVNMLPDSVNSILLTGMYWEKGKKGGRGIYYIKINPSTWELEVMKFNKFEKKAIEPDYSYDFTELFCFKDGSVSVVLEESYVTIQCSQNRNGGTTCHDIYHSNGIYQYDMDKEGNLTNSFVVPKMQKMTDIAMYNGHIALVGKTKKIHYIYNDNGKNYIPKKIQKHGEFGYTFGRSRKTRLCCATQGKKDKASKKPMTESWKKDIIITPTFVLNDGTERAYTWGRTRKKKALFMVEVYLD
ncbi:MAG: hypothetical protein H7321_05285 [Bacteroidia bacterium]|nr:hypothetical protein [Bacteroidia bacterium]